MAAGQKFDDRTLARVTGVPHYHVGRIIRELNYVVDSQVQEASHGLYHRKYGDEDTWKTETFPLADAGEPALVFNIKRMETTLVHGDQYQQINNFTYRQVIESLANVFNASEEYGEEEKRTILDRVRGFVDKTGPFVDTAVRLADLAQKMGGGG